MLFTRRFSHVIWSYILLLENENGKNISNFGSSGIHWDALCRNLLNDGYTVQGIDNMNKYRCH